MKTLDYYKSVKYPIELVETEEGVIVSHPDLPGCHSFGETIADAIASLGEVRSLWLEGHFKHYGSAPEPRREDDYSGKFILRVPKYLHRDLEKAARREGTSLNQLVVSLLSKSLAQRESGKESSRLRESLDQVCIRLDSLCGASRLFTGNVRASTSVRYLPQASSKKDDVVGMPCPGFLPSGSTIAEDEEALVFASRSSAARFESKIRLTGKIR